MSEERSVTEYLLELLREPQARLSVELVKRVQEALASAAVPEGLEDILSEMVERWERIIDLLIAARLSAFLGSGVECSEAGIDTDICLFMKRLVTGYKALLAGQIIVDDAGHVYIRLLRQREVYGMLLPRGTVTAVDAGLGLLLYAIGDAELASIKPLRGG